MKRCDSLFKRTLGCADGRAAEGCAADTSARKDSPDAGDIYRTIVLTSSGTGAMEAVVMNCLSSTDRVIVIDGGSFGHRFVQLCELHHIPFDRVEVPFGQTLTADMLAPLADGGHTALIVNLDETSVGQLYDIHLLSSFCRENGLHFIVDAISAYLVDPIDMVEDGIDALIVSSQKALALAPGISLVMLSPRMVERVVGNTCVSMYFDFPSYLRNGERGQTPFTPAVGTIYELEEMLTRIMDSGGAEAWISHTHEVAVDFRARLTALPLEIPAYPLSNGLTPIVFPEGGALECNRRLVSEYGFVLNPCGGERADTMSRVAHMGNHSIEDNVGSDRRTGDSSAERSEAALESRRLRPWGNITWRNRSLPSRSDEAEHYDAEETGKVHHQDATAMPQIPPKMTRVPPRQRRPLHR